MPLIQVPIAKLINDDHKSTGLAQVMCRQLQHGRKQAARLMHAMCSASKHAKDVVDRLQLIALLLKFWYTNRHSH